MNNLIKDRMLYGHGIPLFFVMMSLFISSNLYAQNSQESLLDQQTRASQLSETPVLVVGIAGGGSKIAPEKYFNQPLAKAGAARLNTSQLSGDFFTTTVYPSTETCNQANQDPNSQVEFRGGNNVPDFAIALGEGQYQRLNGGPVFVRANIACQSGVKVQWRKVTRGGRFK